MATKKDKAHQHKFDKIIEWITEPGGIGDLYHEFKVLAQCECGVRKQRYTDLHEVEEFIKVKTCSCGIFDSGHSSYGQCIQELQLRVKYLEDKLEKVCDALSGIGR